MARKIKRIRHREPEPKVQIPRQYPNPTDFDISDPQSGASLLDMYACAAPPPPDEYNPVLTEKEPVYPPIPKWSREADEAWLYWSQEGEFLPSDLERLQAGERTQLVRHCDKVRAVERAIVAYKIGKELHRQIQWRWIFARRMLAARKAAHEEPIHHVR